MPSCVEMWAVLFFHEGAAGRAQPEAAALREWGPPRIRKYLIDLELGSLIELIFTVRHKAQRSAGSGRVP